MTVPLSAEKPPLVRDESGRIRIAGTRIPLETVITAFQQGVAPDDIVLEYPSLTRADVYAVIAYYLRHQADVDKYVRQRSRLLERTIQAIDRQSPPGALRKRLKNRLSR